MLEFTRLTVRPTILKFALNTSGALVPRLVRLVLILIGGVFVLFLGVVAVTAAVYSPTYVFRYLTLMDADVGDHVRFPARTVEASAPHRFVEAEAGAEGSVVSALEGTSAGRWRSGWVSQRHADAGSHHIRGGRQLLQ